jgi:hypothetical protein
MATAEPDQPVVTEHDVKTGETVVRPMTDDELAQAELDKQANPGPE